MTKHYSPDNAQLNENSKEKKEWFLKVLIEDAGRYTSWIARKEIAAWSATALFLYVLMIVFTNIEKMNTAKLPIVIFILAILFLLMLFIHQQFSVFCNSVAVQIALKFWFYKTIDQNKIPEEFDFTLDSQTEQQILDSTLKSKEPALNIHPPMLLKTINNAQRKIVRPHSFIKRLFLIYIWTFYKIFFPNKKITNSIELEESILYNIIILFSITLIFYIYKDEIYRHASTLIEYLIGK